jgi:serine/threonine-protein kinase
MREVGRAIALDPGNPSAMGTMIRLLTEVPRELPAGVSRERDEAADQSERAAARLAAPLYMSWLLFAPLVYAMGIRHYAWAFAMAALWTGAALVSLVSSRRPTWFRQLATLVLSNAAAAASAGVFGALFYVPGLVTANAAPFMVARSRARRYTAVVLALLAIAVPLALEVAGIVSPAYAFADGTVVVLPRGVSLPRAPTLALLLFGAVALLLIPCVFLAHAHERLSLAEDRLRFHAWQLRQLVPDEATPSIAAR